MTCFTHPDTHPLHAAEKHLRQQDAFLASLIDRHGPCHLADTTPSHFHVLIKTILDQQLSVKAAARIGERLLATQGGHAVYLPEKLVELDDTAFRECGVSAQKIRYIRGIANAVMEGQLDFERMNELSDEACIQALIQFKGVGQWTAELFLMFSCNRLDILPLGDLALRRALENHYDVQAGEPLSNYLQIAEPWRPYRSIASWYLWAAVD